MSDTNPRQHTATYYTQLAAKLDAKADAVDNGGGTHGDTYREMADNARAEAQRAEQGGGH